MITETSAPIAHAKICPECGELFETTHAGKVFCTDKCREAYGNVALKRGKPVIPLLITWRRHRGTDTGKRALRELCRIVSMYIEEDRTDKRECALQLEALWGGFHLSKYDRPAKAKPSKAGAAASGKADPLAGVVPLNQPAIELLALTRARLAQDD